MSLSLDAHDLHVVARSLSAFLWSVEHLWYLCNSERNFLDQVYAYVREHCERDDEECRRRAIDSLLQERWWWLGDLFCLSNVSAELADTLKRLSDGRLAVDFMAYRPPMRVDATSLAVLTPAHMAVRYGDATIAELLLTVRFTYSRMSGEWRIGFSINDAYVHETVRRAICLESPSSRACRGYTPPLHTLSEFMP